MKMSSSSQMQTMSAPDLISKVSRVWGLGFKDTWDLGNSCHRAWL